MVNNETRRGGAGHGVVQRLSARLHDLGLVDSKPLVGLSGGADSTALAIGMSEALRGSRLRPRLAHIEHRVRPGAGQDVITVLSTAQRLALPLSIRAIPDGVIASHVGTGPEEAMRRERFLLLARLAAETACTAVLTAHHADDQAETVLGHLIRGSGLSGAAGIRSSTTLSVPWWRSSAPVSALVVIRPLLAERRRDLKALVSHLDLTVVDDETNRDVDRTRAALRHRVLPVLEEIHPGAALALSRFAALARAAVDEPLHVPGPPSRDGEFDGRGLTDLPVGAQRLAVRTWVAAGSGLDLTFERTEAVRRWVAGGGSGSLEIGGGWSIWRSGRTITLHDGNGDRRPITR